MVVNHFLQQQLWWKCCKGNHRFIWVHLFKYFISFYSKKLATWGFLVSRRTVFFLILLPSRKWKNRERLKRALTQELNCFTDIPQHTLDDRKCALCGMLILLNLGKLYRNIYVIKNWGTVVHKVFRKITAKSLIDYASSLAQKQP